MQEGGEENRLQENTVSTEVKKELNCCIHKAITNSEAILNIHLQGKKHWVKREELKASKHKTITTASNESNQNKGDPKKVELKEWNCSVCEVTTQSEIAFNSHLQGRKHKAKCEEIKDQTKCVSGDGQNLNGIPNKEANVGVIAKREQKRPIKENQYWYRYIYCNVWCSSEIAMNYHVNGSMHIQGLNKWYFSGVADWVYGGNMIFQ